MLVCKPGALLNVRLRKVNFSGDFLGGPDLLRFARSLGIQVQNPLASSNHRVYKHSCKRSFSLQCTQFAHCSLSDRGRASLNSNYPTRIVQRSRRFSHASSKIGLFSNPLTKQDRPRWARKGLFYQSCSNSCYPAGNAQECLGDPG